LTIVTTNNPVPSNNPSVNVNTTVSNNNQPLKSVEKESQHHPPQHYHQQHHHQKDHVHASHKAASSNPVDGNCNINPSCANLDNNLKLEKLLEMNYMVRYYEGFFILSVCLLFFLFSRLDYGTSS
jgi:hypothetical protein